MAKSKDTRIDKFRDEALSFVTENIGQMKNVFDAYIKEKSYDKAVNLYMKLADKVIPSLPTQDTSTTTDTRPEWAKKIDRAKKTIEVAKDDVPDKDSETNNKQN